MPTDIRSSLLLTGDTSQLQAELGADWAPDLNRARSKFKEHFYRVAVLPATEENFAELLKLAEELRQLSPEIRLVLVNQNLSTDTLWQLINRVRPFKLINSYKDPQLNSFIHQALEEYQLSRQNTDLLQLVHEQNEKLKKLNKTLESKVNKRQKFLTQARERLLRTNQQVEALHGALLAIHRSQSVGEMEFRLNEALAKHLQLSWIRILFSSHSQSNLLQKDMLSSPDSIRVYKAPLHNSSNKTGNIYFARPIKKSDFSSEEVDFLHQIAETVALAIDRLRTLEQTHSLKAQWEVTFDAIAEPLCITDNKFKILKMNRAYMMAAGKTYNELIGKNCFKALSDQPVPSELQKGKNYRWEVFSSRQMDRKIFDVSLRPLTLKLIPEKALLVLFRNITEQLRLERQILEGAKMAELGTISSSIAHELNNPLGGIISFLQLIRRDLHPDSDIKEDIEAMEEATTRCKEIIESLLGFARWDNLSDTQQFDLCEVTSQAVKIMELQTRSQGISFNTTTPDQPCLFVGQASHLSQALRNLIQNAIDAVKEQMSRDPGFQGKIDVSLKTTTQDYQIKVTDNGPGIETKNQQKIFNPLYTTKTTLQNLGLGLTVAFKIISDHEGVLEISSQSGAGTSARISLKRPDLKA